MSASKMQVTFVQDAFFITAFEMDLQYVALECLQGT